MKSKTKVELAGGVPFVSDADLKTTLDKAGVPTQAADAIVAENAKARLEGVALITLGDGHHRLDRVAV